MVEKYSVSLKTLLQQGISEPEFYGDLVYRFRKIVGKSNFLEQFRKLINRYKRIGYRLDIMRVTALRLPRLGKRELILVLFVCLFDFRMFGFVCFLFLLVSGRAAVCDCGTPWTFLLPFFSDTHLYLDL